MKALKTLRIILFVLTALMAWEARSAVVVDYSDTSDGLLVTWSGSINTSALTVDSANVNLSTYNRLLSSQLIIATEAGTAMTSWKNMSMLGGTVSLSGGIYNPVISMGSTPFAYQTNPLIWLPSDYISGSEIWGSCLFEGESIASVSPNENFSMSWGSGENADSLTVTLNAVPEPSSILLIGLGAFIAYACRYFHRRIF